MRGQDIIRQIISATQLPQDYAQKRLNQLIIDSGHDPSKITLTELRPILADFLQSTLVEAKSKFNEEGA